MRFAEEDVLICMECGATTLRTGPVQKYCRTCSAAKDRERKRKWANENPQEPKRRRASTAKRTQRHMVEGARRSFESRASVAWMAEWAEPSFTQVLRVSVPFTYKFSKNALWSMSSQGHVFMREDIHAVRDGLVATLRNEKRQWFDGKVWIDIFVEKPDARGDAINVIDLVCDAVKRAIGIDDRWFCIRRLDWSIVKEDPKIYVGVAQAVTEHHRCCSYCGRIFPLASYFNRNRTGRHGYGRVCNECNRNENLARAGK